MNYKSYILRFVWRSLSVMLGMLLLFGSTGFAAVQPVALVRVDLRTSTDLQNLAAEEISVYAQLYTEEGAAYLLAALDSRQQALLVRQGFSLKTVDSDVWGQTYYLISARRPADFEKVSSLATVLQADGRQAIIRAAPTQAEKLPALGFEIRLLIPHPIVLPKEVSALPEGITPDPLVAEMIAQVNSGTVYTYDGDLSGEWPVDIGGLPYTIATRYTKTKKPIQMAWRYAYEHFQSLGLPVSYHQYRMNGVRKNNVVAEQAGLSEPGRIFLVTAHLDSITYANPNQRAPGADDNASGSVAVLVAADILSQYDFGCTLRYVLFTGEEQGLVGSYYYARDADRRGDDIEGVLNLDMIAYNSNSFPIMDLHTRPGNANDLAIANLFAGVVDAYDINLTPHIFQDGPTYSDHASFWEFGYSAIIGIEDDDDFSPYYHSTGDQLETLDLNYFTEFVKAAVGTFAHMGCLLDEDVR